MYAGSSLMKNICHRVHKKSLLVGIAMFQILVYRNFRKLKENGPNAILYMFPAVDKLCDK